MQYLMLIAAAGRRLSPTTYAAESACVEHLRALRRLLAPRFTEIVVAMPEMPAADYEQAKAGFTEVHEAREGIRFESTFETSWSNRQFAAMTPSLLRKLGRIVKQADVVHSGMSFNIYRPIEFAASILGVALRKKVIAVTDMDNRRAAEMSYRLGMVSKRRYLVWRYLHDPLRHLQQRAFVTLCDLVLFKEPQQVADYGSGAPHVRLILDPNFSPDQMATEAVMTEKIRALEDPRLPLRVLYFGRLVEYKGVEKMIEAVAAARKRGAHLTFDIMGSGPEEQKYRALVDARGIADVVSFIAPRAYGPAFFDIVRARDVLLACPLLADTPRSTWDALASGVPLLAFDSPFYVGIAELTGAVDVTAWPEVEPLAARLVELAANKQLLVPMARRALQAARDNTGDGWLERRVQWVEELFTTPA